MGRGPGVPIRYLDVIFNVSQYLLAPWIAIFFFLLFWKSASFNRWQKAFPAESNGPTWIAIVGCSYIIINKIVNFFNIETTIKISNIKIPVYLFAKMKVSVSINKQFLYAWKANSIRKQLLRNFGCPSPMNKRNIIVKK